MFEEKTCLLQLIGLDTGWEACTEPVEANAQPYSTNES